MLRKLCQSQTNTIFHFREVFLNQIHRTKVSNGDYLGEGRNRKSLINENKVSVKQGEDALEICCSILYLGSMTVYYTQ